MQTEDMYVQLKLVLDADPAAAWRALRSTSVMRELYAPFIGVNAGNTASKTHWQNTTDEIPLMLAGLVPLGRQLIELDYDETSHPGVKILRDTGSPASGPLSALRGWNHRMAVSATADDPGRTLFRDRLTFHGPAVGAYWYPLWVMWQWRGSRLRDMAPNWAFDPELRDETSTQHL
ncbi:hypothetical protein [Paramicrobacterium chengjingii]|uniref:SRPBCC family protein n=1 Tax=Paramicrobacterium chengjingii TaxID=2769067 RepID=A0ABX6YFJ9_9MICO|nr:hypothetical protein [Microbacterium chengjingii]QPZ37568.1 hypothetical protein HCR76_12105 [Microbacterium chengjingii]